MFFSPSANQSVDLISVDILRGRDFGLPPYTTFREACNLKLIRTFEDLVQYIVNPMVQNLNICDCAHKNQEPIQNSNFLLPTKNYCLTFPLSPLQISEQKNPPLRSNCHLKLHFSVIKKSTFRIQTPDSM